MNNKILEQGRFASTMIDYFRIPMGYSTMLYFIALVLFVVSQHSWANPVTQERLIAGPEEGSDWLAHGRDLSETRYSPLQQITSENISGLGLAWSFDLPYARGLEGTPLVADGVMYVSGNWSVVHALNAATGKKLWTYDPGVDRKRANAFCCGVVNRGVALWENSVLIATLV